MTQGDWISMSAHIVIVLIFLVLWAELRGLRRAIQILTALIAAMNNKPRHE